LLHPGLQGQQQQQRREEEEEDERSAVPPPPPLFPAVAHADGLEPGAALFSSDSQHSLEHLTEEGGIVWQAAPSSATAATGEASHAVAATVEIGLRDSELRLPPQGLEVNDVGSLATRSTASSASNHVQGLYTLVPEQLQKLSAEMATLKEQLAQKSMEVQARDGVIEALLSEQADGDRLKKELSTALHTIETLKTNIIDDREGQCVICFEGTPCYALVPCGHLLLCQRCAGGSLEQCPVCRRKVESSLRVYRA